MLKEMLRDDLGRLVVAVLVIDIVFIALATLEGREDRRQREAFTLQHECTAVRRVNLPASGTSTETAYICERSVEKRNSQ